MIQYIILLLAFLFFWSICSNKEVKEGFESGYVEGYPKNIYPNLELRNTTKMVGYDKSFNPWMEWDTTFNKPLLPIVNDSYVDEIAEAYRKIEEQDSYITSVLESQSKKRVVKPFQKTRFCRQKVEGANYCFQVDKDEKCVKGEMVDGIEKCDFY